MLRQRLKILIACILTVLCVASAVRAVKASSMSYLYRKTRYGLYDWSVRDMRPTTHPNSAPDPFWKKPHITDPTKTAEAAHVAEKHYPEHYLFFAHAASVLWDEARVARDAMNFETFNFNINKALHFSKTALSLNPYGEQTRRVYVDVLTEAGRLDEAIDYWRENVYEREFWKGINHDKMAYLLLKSDDPEHLREAVTVLTPPPNQNIWLIQDRALRERLRKLQKVVLK